LVLRGSFAMGGELGAASEQIAHCRFNHASE
jgi:hypothetical protein